MIYFQNTLKA